MTKCQICGKNLKNPNSKAHINSEFHQKKLNEINSKTKNEMLNKCPKCSRNIENDWVYCPYCSYVLKENELKETNKNSKELDFIQLKVINGNSEFKKVIKMNNWAGNGIKSNPYIIDGLIIKSKNEDDGIYINNTDCFFIIQNCILENCKGTGISLKNVKNGIIKKNKIVSNNKYGIFLYNSNQNLIIENQISKNNESGLILVNCKENQIYKNNLHLNNINGIHLYYSSENIIKENEARSNEIGIALQYSLKNQILENKSTYNNHGISLILSKDNKIEKNLVLSNNKGISLAKSSNNLIIENKTPYNNKSGIYLMSSLDNIIKNNTTKPSPNHEIYFYKSPENQVE